MACFWMLDLLPLAITALIPVAFYPLLGAVIKNSEIADTGCTIMSEIFRHHVDRRYKQILLQSNEHAFSWGFNGRDGGRRVQPSQEDCLRRHDLIGNFTQIADDW